MKVHRYQKISTCLVFLLLHMVCAVRSQISPPGLGEAKTASWLAVGLQQNLDTVGDWQSMTYFGLGRKSDLVRANPISKPAITVLNQEFYHTFSNHWKSSLALSYRRQPEYAEDDPYMREAAEVQQEFRAYGRISYTVKMNRFAIVPTLRQEFRRFYRQDFKNADSPRQLRSRFRIQVSTYLDPDKKHKIMGSSEQLFAVKQAEENKSWSKFQYNESRFMLYYSYNNTNLPFVFDIGYMNDLIYDGHRSKPVHYVAFDVIVKNPFSKR